MKGAGKEFSCPWLFIHLLFSKRAVPLGENSSQRNYFIDGKQSMDNLNTKKHIDFHSWQNRTCYKRKLLLNLIQNK